LLKALGGGDAGVVARLMSLIYPKPTSSTANQQPIVAVSLGDEKCPWCPAVYYVEVCRVADHEKHKFKCVNCKRIVATWSGANSFKYRLVAVPEKLRTGNDR